ncbi:hypothetical protein DFJ74DRAFT_679769 [Hyaloraphidium curvatum]|nr:hypothetical protein DFJ74DRAFT_679769 [Hyaloraphidium curvatum]
MRSCLVCWYRLLLFPPVPMPQASPVPPLALRAGHHDPRPNIRPIPLIQPPATSPMSCTPSAIASPTSSTNSAASLKASLAISSTASGTTSLTASATALPADLAMSIIASPASSAISPMAVVLNCESASWTLESTSPIRSSCGTVAWTALLAAS